MDDKFAGTISYAGAMLKASYMEALTSQSARREMLLQVYDRIRADQLPAEVEDAAGLLMLDASTPSAEPEPELPSKGDPAR